MERDCATAWFDGSKGPKYLTFKHTERNKEARKKHREKDTQV